MRRTIRVLLCLLAAACLLMLRPTAWGRPVPPSEQVARLAPGWRATVGTDGRIRSMRSNGDSVTGDRVAAARRFLQDRASLWTPSGSLSDLHPSRAVQVDGNVADVFFTRTVDGLRVVGGGASVHFDARGRLFLVHSNYAPDLALRTTPSLGAQAAFAAALRKARTTPKNEGRSRDRDASGSRALDRSLLARGEWRVRTARLVVYQPGPVGVLAYDVVADGSDPGERVHVFVDAHRGDVLSAESLVRTENGTAGLIFPNPTARANSAGLKKSDGEAAFTGLYEARPLLDISVDGSGRYRLQGPHVLVQDLSVDRVDGLPANTPPVQAGTVFDFPITYFPATSTSHDLDNYDDAFCYHVIDTSARYLHSIGFPTTMDYAIPCDSHALSDAVNASYSGDGSGRGRLYFGGTAYPLAAGNDPAEDATVVLHEYGHAIQDNLSPGGFYYLGTTGGVMEGFADYWAGSSCYEANVATGFPPSYMAPWFVKGIEPDSAFLRDLANHKVYPTDLDNEVHGAGQLWGALLWDVFNALGRDVSDRVVLKSHLLVPADGVCSFDDMAQALLDADQALYGGVHGKTLREICKARGIFGSSGTPVCGTVTYAWIEASQGEKLAFVDLDDDFAKLTLPFEVKALGQVFPAGSQAWLNTNGILHLAPPVYSGLTKIGRSQDSRDYLVFGDWERTTLYPNSLGIFVDDLVVGGPTAPADTGVYTRVTGTAPRRVVTLQFNKVRHYSAPEAASSYTVTFEMQFHEGTNRLLYLFKTTRFGGYPDADMGARAASLAYCDFRRQAVVARRSATLEEGKAVAFALLPVPEGLGAKAESGTTVMLSFSPSLLGEDGVRVERRQGQGEWVEVGSIVDGASSWQDKGLSPSTTYEYRICSFVGQERGAYSTGVSVTTLASGGDPVSLTSAGAAPAGGQPGGGGGGGGCFVATAAYGSYLDPHVVALRRFRDECLLTNAPGRVFVRVYYAWSPPVAGWIARHEVARGAVRLALTPVVLALERRWLFGSWVLVGLACLLFACRRAGSGAPSNGAGAVRGRP